MMGRLGRCCFACVVVSLGVALAPNVAGAQESPGQILTAGSSRAWTLQRFVRPAGPGNACLAGEVYTFAVTHEVAVSRCSGGKIVQSRHAWTVAEADGGDPILTIAGMGSFSLRFQQQGLRTDRMRLRATDGRADPDRELALDED